MDIDDTGRNSRSLHLFQHRPPPHNDTKWINELKQEKKSKKMVAYSKKGARAARIKAIELGLKDVFVDFVSEEEADKARGYKKTS
jgi:hypothetical protein